MQLSLMPIAKNPNDVVYTPDEIAREIVEMFKPAGKCLDPCKGDGAFYKYLPAGSDWCEIDQGRDFFAYTKQVDWIVSNPPYSLFIDWMVHSFEIAENIVYLIPINKPFNSLAAIDAVYKYGGIKHIHVMGTGRHIGLVDLGYATGAVYFKRGYAGPITVTRRNGTPNNVLQPNG